MLCYVHVIEKLLRSVPGFLSWGSMRTAIGFTTFTLCKDKAGCDQDVVPDRANKSIPRLVLCDGAHVDT